MAVQYRSLHIVNVGYRSTNYYVLVSPTTRLLIDAGWPDTLPQFRHELKRKGFDLRDIQYLLCTHYHPDHAGLAQEIKQAGVQLLVIEEQQAAVPHHITRHDVIHLSTTASRTFLDRCAIDGEILWTPGHSDDSINLVLDSGIAFTGDLLPPLDSADPSYPLAAHSWYKLQTHGVRQVYPGHGPVHPYRGAPS